MRTSPGRAQRARTGAPRRGNEKVPKRKSWEFRCVRNFVGRARGENNDNEAKKCYREALYLDPTYSSAQQSLTALEAPEARAAEQPSPLLVLQSNAGMLAGLKQLGLVPEHGAATLRNLHRTGLDRLSIQQLAEVGLSRGPRRGRRGRGRSSGPLSLSPLPSQVGLESLNAEIRADRTGFEDLLCSN